MALPKVRATRFLRRTRGGSRAILCEASDGNFYVCKSPVNPQSRDVLGSEYIYTRFGEMIGSQVQPQAAVDFGEDIIEQALAGGEGYDARALKASYRPSSEVGPYYGSLCPVNPITTEVYDFIPPDYASRLVHPERIGAILALDAWLYQRDSRQIIYWPKGKQLHWAAIDHGYTGFMTLAARSEEWQWDCAPQRNLPIPFTRIGGDNLALAEAQIESAAHKIAAIRPASIASVLESCPETWKPDEKYNEYAQTLAAITLRKNAIMIIKSAYSLLYDAEDLGTSAGDCRDHRGLPRAKQGKIGVRAKKPKAGAATDTGAESAANPRRDRDRYGRRNPANTTIPGARLVSWLDPDQSEE